MKISNRKCFIPIITLIVLCVISINTSAADDRVHIRFGSADARKINISVPWFIDKFGTNFSSNLSKELPDILAKSLKFHGIINIIPTSSYGGSQNIDWKSIGADFAILGLFESSAGGLKMELRLFDVTDNRMVLGKTYSGKLSNQYNMIYSYCDTVIKALTGVNGIASTQIAFVSQEPNQKRKELYITDILGRKIRQVTRHKNLVVSPRYIPGGKFLSYTSYHSGNQNLYVTDLRQSKTTRVFSRRKGMNLAPAWTKDGKSLFLTLSYDGNPDIYKLNSRGQITDRLTDNDGINVSPTISPDGKKMVFVSDRFGPPQLFVMDLKTKKAQRITFTGSENAEPRYHPTENLIVYSSLRNGVYQICVKKPELGQKSTQITNDLSHHESPSWSPDGKQIIFSKQDGRVNQVYGIMRNGNYQRRLFSFPGNQTYPQWERQY